VIRSILLQGAGGLTCRSGKEGHRLIEPAASLATQGVVHTVIAQNRLMAVQREVSAGNLQPRSLVPENGDGMK
jgi:hypothetical protein